MTLHLRVGRDSLFWRWDKGEPDKGEPGKGEPDIPADSRGPAGQHAFVSGGLVVLLLNFTGPAVDSTPASASDVATLPWPGFKPWPTSRAGADGVADSAAGVADSVWRAAVEFGGEVRAIC